ncbi:MAG TPA: hypothetical protein VH702_17090 [Vicinamibacterales bacterium]
MAKQELLLFRDSLTLLVPTPHVRAVLQVEAHRGRPVGDVQEVVHMP